MNKAFKILLLFLLVTQNSFAQFTDDFSDGDFSVNPVWTEGAPGDFKDTLGTIRSNNVIASSSYFITTPNTLANDCQWEFFVNLKFATSGTNYVDVYLTADNSNLTSGTLNGYFVRIGNTLDEICLYKSVAGTSSKIIDGSDAIITSSSNNLIKIKVVRNASNQFELFRDMTGTGNTYTSEGTITDATFITSSFFGILIKQSTSSFFKKHFFDDIYVGPIILDLTPPAISSMVVLSTNQLDVYFNEDVEQTSAETVSNYSVNNGVGNPVTALRDGTDFSLVHLTFGNPFTSALQNTITINGVQDLSANPTVNEIGTFTYVSVAPAAYRDVIVNEIFADPSPQVALPAVEFIELYNRGISNYDLTNWTFSDGSSSATLGSYILLQGEYLIICSIADTALFSPYGNVLGVNSFPGLNNAADNVIIKDNNNVLIDQVSYLDDWYNDAVKDDGGWSLELKNPTLPCSGSNNWIASNNPSGGTPGTINSVFDNSPDVTIPRISSVSVSSLSQIIVSFTESMDSLSLTGATFTFSNSITATNILPIGPEFNSAIIDFTPVIDSITLYSLSISGATDCSGNSIATTLSYFGIGVKPNKFELVINEIFPNPTGTPGLAPNEFIELRNVTSKVINLGGSTYSDPTSTATLGNKIIYPNGLLILCAASDENLFNNNFGRALGISPWPSLNNAGDVLTLKNEDGELIHKVSYTDDWYQDASKASGGWTLEMIDPLNPCGEESNWRASVNPDGGTPGAYNSVNGNNPDADAPIISNAVPSDSVTLILSFNEIMDSVAVVNANYTIDNGVNVLSVSYIDEKKISVAIDPLTYLQYDIIYTITAVGCEDCVGNNNATSKTFALPEQGSPGDLIINEILYDARSGGDDFVEIYNNSQKIINLKDWVFANRTNDTIASNKVITTEDFLIYPGEYAAFTEDQNNILMEYPLGNSARIFNVIDLPTYNNGEGTVYLITNLNQISDEFTYNDDLQFPLLNSVDGVSLERLDFDRPSSDNTNWHSAAESVNFATPGYVNSQYSAAENSGVVSIDPAVFSPDSDGYQDVINITYEFTEPGFVANVTLFDAAGRIVKLLVQNELLGTSGVMSWDGINERREKANVGVYICYFEVFNTTGKVEKYKIPFVLAAKF